jgi:aminoglycoside phosphotransferase (APT) family kinase protein
VTQVDPHRSERGYLEWLAIELPAGETVIEARPLAGATTAELYDLTVGRPGGPERRLVLRWYADQDFLRGEPGIVEREVAALRALAVAGTSGVPAPELVASGPAAILMTHLPGRIELDPPDPAALLDMLDSIHRVDPGPLRAHRYVGYHEGVELARPSWWRDAGSWERAVCQTETARPTGPDRFIHRDFHPGNVLWTGREVSGVIDWGSACVGPAAVDLAHFRVNLAVLHGIDAADRIGSGDPAWDIELAFGFVDWASQAAVDAWEGPSPHVAPPIARDRLEAFVARAIARLG